MGKFVETMYDAITLGMEKEFPQRVAFRYYTEETDTVTTVLFKELAQDVRRTVTYLQNTIPDVKADSPSFSPSFRFDGPHALRCEDGNHSYGILYHISP